MSHYNELNLTYEVVYEGHYYWGGGAELVM